MAVNKLSAYDMQKNFILIFIFCLIANVFKAQHNQWVWKHGSQNVYAPEVVGVIGFPSTAYNPHSTYGALGWTDSKGKFWLYGGVSGTAVSTLTSELSPANMWMYDPVNDTWAWMQGAGTSYQAPQNSGIGVAAASNSPGGRAFGAACWVDSSDNLWMYGGGTGLDPDYYTNLTVMNDLWMFNTTTLEWTFWGGSTPSVMNLAGSYGVQGVPSATNLPPAREEVNCSWVDASYNLWFFGGSMTEYHNDLWKFDMALKQWVWMNGTNLTNQNEVGLMGGGFAAANTPRGNGYIYNSWQDNTGKFWLTGGGRYITNPIWEYYNDIWCFDPTINQWAWIKGNGNYGNLSVNGVKCIPDTLNQPNAESLLEARGAWSDDCGNLWMYASNRANSLYMYSIKNNSWVWIAGSGNFNSQALDMAPVYGLLNTPNAANHPGYRSGNTAFRRKNVNELFFYGGIAWPVGSTNYTHGAIKNDLWMYTPDKPTALYTYATSDTCLPIQIDFTNQSLSGCNEIKSYQWDFGDPASGANNISSLENPSHSFLLAGTYPVKLIVTNCTGSKDSITHSIVVLPKNLAASVTTQTITCNGFNDGEIVISNLSGTNPYMYVWSNSQTTNGISNLPAGVYSFTVVDAQGCIATQTLTVTQPQPLLIQPPVSYSVCVNTQAIITPTLTGGTNPYNYTWSNGASTLTSTQLINGSSILTLTVTDANNCVNTSSVTVNNYPAITANFFADDTLGCPNHCVALNLLGNNIVSYSWSFGDGNSSSQVSPTHCYTTSGVYDLSVTLTDIYSCQTTISKNNYIQVVANPVASFTAAPITATLLNPVISYSDLSTGAAIWNWSFGESPGSVSTSQNPAHTFSDTGTYFTRLIVENTLGCSDTAYLTIYILPDFVFYIPNVFSPNQDGVNDSFGPLGKGVQPKGYSMKIFDRWGKMLWETNVWGENWNGQVIGNSNQAQTGVYVYSISINDLFNEAHFFSGNVTLIK